MRSIAAILPCLAAVGGPAPGGGGGPASAGPSSPGTLASVDPLSTGAPAWSDPGNAASSNNSYATASPDGFLAKETEMLEAKNFGFAIPGGATITKVKAEVEAKADSITGSPTWMPILTYNGEYVGGGTTPIALATSDTYQEDVEPDLWNVDTTGSSISVLTPAVVNDASFGVWIAGGADIIGRTISIDHIRLTIDYTT